MIKRISVLTLLSISLLFSGCTKDNEEKEDMYLAGYIVDIEDDYIEVVSSQGDFKFDISDAIIDKENEMEVDGTCEIYYQDELSEDNIIKANKVVPYFDGYLIGEISNINGDEFTITSEGNSYVFKLENSDVNLEELDLTQIYDVEFDKKLSSTSVNIAKELNLIEVDNAPSEELELVESFNGVIED
ncbi:MAG: hypothetical protein MJ245_06160 [Clostridia bacterium]|nr:hypothetical protein [Clostridia bacterium]